MQDTKRNGAIDVDELVSALLSEKAAKTGETPSAAPVVEDVTPVATDEGQSEQPAELPADVETVEETLQEEIEEDVPAALPKKAKKKAFSWFRRARKEDDDDFLEEEWADWGLTPIGHYTDAAKEAAAEQTTVDETAAADISSGREDVEPAPQVTEQAQEDANELSSGRPDAPAVDAPAEKDIDTAATMVIPSVQTVVDDATRVVELQPTKPAVEPEDTVEQLPDQLSLEELVRVEDVEDAPQEDEDVDIAAQLQQAREEKVKNFVLGGEEEEENEPEEEAVEEIEEESEIDDFTGYETTDAVRLEMQYRCRAGFIGMLLTAGLELLLLVLTLATVASGLSPITTVGYLTVHVFGLILMLVLNYAAVSHGLSGLFTLKANNDTAPAVATVMALCGVIIHFLNMDMPLPTFAPLAGLLMLLNAIGQYVKVLRIRENFAFVSYQGDKYSAGLIEDEKAAVEIGRSVMTEEVPQVAYFRRTAFLSSYLNNAYEEDGGDRYAVFATPIAMGVALVLSLTLLAVGMADGFWAWLSAFNFMLCLSSFSTLVLMQVPMKRACRRMLSRGGFLVGWNAVDALGAPDALVVDVADLYPDESMLLHGIKTFSGAHIDTAILDAASLSIRAGGPLSMIFRRIIENNESLLREVDSLAYEQGMGLSGWVDGRRVLVGNRRLLQNHDVDVPSSDYEARYAKNGRRLVYLSTSGVLSAMFVVSYLPDETIGDALRDLCRARVGLLVRSNDSNVTAEDLCRDFELDEYYVEVLPAVAGRMVDRLVAEDAADVPALMASNGHILGSAMALATCRSLRVKSRLVLAVQTIMALLGLGLCVPWALASIGSYFLPAFGVMVGSALLGWLVPLLKH